MTTRTLAENTLGTDIATATTAEEGLQMAGLDWGIKIVDADNLTITTPDGNTQRTSIPGMRMVMRDDNHTTLGVVGGRYTAIDNRTAFSLADHLMEQGAHPTFAGSLGYGRQTYMNFAVPGLDVKVGGQDLIKFGMRITANHDGTGHVRAGLTATRLVCTNGMMASLQGFPHEFRIRHTQAAGQHIETARSIIQDSMRFAKGFAALAEQMLDTPMTSADFERYIDVLHPEPDVEQKRAHSRWERLRREMRDLFLFAKTNEFGRDTHWGAYNAVTEHMDWVASVRSSAQQSDTRALRQFENAVGSKGRDTALEVLMDRLPQRPALV